ncbi:MAG TPA: M67 family metallopeptidase [Gemmatimonadales bacterium]|nr:M67 family metallopeptidase [Gemmatimonadales bacterium]
MTLRVNEALLDEIRRQSEQAYPAECCGLLAGRSGARAKEVLRLKPVTNQRTDDPHRYLISAEDLRGAARELERSGLEVLGFYHSHPDHPAVPSAFDQEHAWPWYSYLIVQVEGGRSGDVASWVLNDDRSKMRAESLDVFTEV